MSKNNTIRKSDKKFIRTEKARIRRDFLDVKKQQELINKLYERFVPKVTTDEAKITVVESKKEAKKPAPKKDLPASAIPEVLQAVKKVNTKK